MPFGSKAPLDGPADPVNLYDLADEHWKKFDIAQRMIFNSTIADMSAAMNSGAMTILESLDSTQRFNVTWLAGWVVATHLGANHSLRTALVHLDHLLRLDPPEKEIG